MARNGRRNFQTMTRNTRLTARSAAALMATLSLGGLAPVVTPGTAMAQGGGECRGEPTGTKLHVIVEGVHSDKGEITYTLYGDDPLLFLKGRGELKVWRERATPPTQEMCVWLSGPGSYAMAVYQDTNGNHRFDHGVFTASEPYGFSRNPHLFMGPPSVGQVKFTAGEGDTSVRITMRNP